MVDVPMNFFKVKEDVSVVLSRAAEIETLIDELRIETSGWSSRRPDGTKGPHNVIPHLESAARHAAKASAYLHDAFGSAIGDLEPPPRAVSGS